MKVIYGNKVYTVKSDTGLGLELWPIESEDEHETFYVGYNDPELIIDPTDGDLEEVGYGFGH